MALNFNKNGLCKASCCFVFSTIFLQASKCWNNKLQSLPISILPQVVEKKLPLDGPAKGYAVADPDPGPDPSPKSHLDDGGGYQANHEFNPEFNLDTDPDFKANLDADPGYESGYESDTDSKANEHKHLKDVSTQQPSSLSDPRKDNVYFDFKSWMETMRERADRRRNIQWKLSGDELVREVGNNGSSNSLYASEDYIVQGLNIYRAAKRICALYGQGGIVFADKAREFIEYYYDCLDQPKSEDFWIDTIKKLNKAVVLHLQKRIFKKEDENSINAKLRLAENYVGLDDTHYNVTTIFSIDGKKFALEDKKWLKPTEKQQRAYRNKESEKWYLRLDPFEQKFIDVYQKKLTDGNHYIPTQLRSIPGCRNAYQKRVMAYDENNHPILLGGYYHSGSLASPIEWADKVTDFQMTQDNWEQVTNHCKDIEVISLNYNMNLLGFEQAREKKIVEDTQKVVGNDRFMNLSINGIGTCDNLDNQFNKLVNQAVAFYQPTHSNVCKYFNEERKKKSCFEKICSFAKKEDPTADRNKAIEEIGDLKDKNLFKQLAVLEAAAKKSQIWNNVKQTAYVTDNPNATLCANYIACKAVLGQAKDQAIASVLVFCKSGKDRTGLMSYLVDTNIIVMHGLLNVTDSLIAKELAHSGHYQGLAGINAGSPGRPGLKPVKGTTLSRDYSDQLFLKAAMSTNIPLGKEPVEEIDD
ncbi:hypothetical protein [Cardinium endosymbiont of Philonthus spinipes]|uniref:hypothetical protein n=1 Tax=Cardinium endosymbiont of Philonthus spinipes TaxID=3077941 RepID=UPI00313DECA0